MRTANPEQAVVICDDLLDAYPDAVRALRLRGQALEALGDATRAAQDYEHVLDISPTDTETGLSYARALWRLGRKEEAALEAQHLLDFVPNDLDAQRIAAEAVTLHVGDSLPPVGRLAAARAQFAVGRNQQAISAVRKLVAQSPDRLDARLVLAEFLWGDGQRIQAADVCQQILDEQPDCLPANALLAQVWRGVDALRHVHMRAVNEADPDHREIQDLLGAQDLFEVADVPAAPTLTGFAEEDVRDTSDDPDHDDYVNQLRGADVGPITPQDRPLPNDASDEMNDADPLGSIGTYAPLAWEPSQGQANAPVNDGREAWVKALEEKFAAKPEVEADEILPAPVVVVEKAVAKVEAAPEPPSEWMPATKAEANPGSAMTQVLTPAIAPSTPPKPARPARRDALAAARSAVQTNTLENAITHYRKAIRANKQVDEVLTDVMVLAATQPSREWFVLLGEAYTSKGNIEAALEAYRKASETRD